MFSRAHLLIEREYEKFKKESPWGIEAMPLSKDNIFEWVAKIKGLRNTVWEDGTFTLYMKFDENFNYRPPEVCFHTIPFHPNVDMVTGRPAVDFLDDYSQWEETYTISHILLTIQSLLAHPDMKKPVNPEAAEMIMHSPHAYRQMVLDCVVASQRVEGTFQGLDPTQYVSRTPHTDLESRVRFKMPEESRSTRKFDSVRTAPRVAKLSFEDYHVTWSGIATSKARPDLKNPLLESIKDRPELQKVHLGLPKEELEDQMKRQIEEHETLMYGRFKSQPTEQDEKAAKLARLSKMKKIYLPPRISPTGTQSETQPPPPSAAGFHSETMPPPPSAPSGKVTGHKDEPWEKEVDDLVAWSSKLDATALET